MSEWYYWFWPFETTVPSLRARCSEQIQLWRPQNDTRSIRVQLNLIRPLEYFESDRKNTPVAIRLRLGWVFVATCFKAVAQSESDSKLADQLRSCYKMQAFAATRQVDPRSAADARASKLLQETTYHDGFRYQVGMLWADVESSL